MNIEVSIGEIVDKLTILEIKKERIQEEEKLKNIIKEYDYLYDIVFNQLLIEKEDFKNLKDVNISLWEIEDHIRDKERDKIFDEQFVVLARSVYITNDVRAKVKKEINIKYKSNFVEEKSYKSY
jgi:hypothetical protein